MTEHWTAALHVVDLAAQDTHALRRTVLRDGDPMAVVEFAEDSWAGVFHLGARDGARLVGVSSWIPRPAPEELIDRRETDAKGDGAGRDGAARTGVQLRGMATADGWRGSGVGALLVEAGCARCRLDGVAVVWARARDPALDFYRRHKFEVIGDTFVDATTRLPHHLIRRALR